MWAAHGPGLAGKVIGMLQMRGIRQVTSFASCMIRASYSSGVRFVPVERGAICFIFRRRSTRPLAKQSKQLTVKISVLLSASWRPTQFACNVINVGKHVIMGAVETDLAERLRGLGYDVAALDLSEFQRGGGSAKALTLRLSDTSLATVSA